MHGFGVFPASCKLSFLATTRQDHGDIHRNLFPGTSDPCYLIHNDLICTFLSPTTNLFWLWPMKPKTIRDVSTSTRAHAIYGTACCENFSNTRFYWWSSLKKACFQGIGEKTGTNLDGILSFWRISCWRAARDSALLNLCAGLG